MCHNRMKEISDKADYSLKWKTIPFTCRRDVIRIC